jgi:hypothetical protein
MKMLSGASISRSRNWKKGQGYQLTSGERKQYQILMSPSAHRIYRNGENKNRIEIVLVKTRKSFYQILRQIIGK